jgi:hypothetical protein
MPKNATVILILIYHRDKPIDRSQLHLYCLKSIDYETFYFILFCFLFYLSPYSPDVLSSLLSNSVREQ